MKVFFMAFLVYILGPAKNDLVTGLSHSAPVSLALSGCREEKCGEEM